MDSKIENESESLSTGTKQEHTWIRVTTANRINLDDLEVEEEDEALLNKGFVKNVVNALRFRRRASFINEIKGSVTTGKLSCCVKWAYAAPSLATTSLTVLISVYGIQFYEQVGASLSYIAFFQAMARGLDVISDPSMSYWTDSCRSKHGRRRPFIAAACVPYGICLVGLLFPYPTFDGVTTSIWFGIFYILFFLCNTAANIPYDAIGPELTDNSDDRSRLFSLVSLFEGLGSLAAVALPVLLRTLINKMRSIDYTSCNTIKNGYIDVESCSNFLNEAAKECRWNAHKLLGMTESMTTTLSVASSRKLKGMEAIINYTESDCTMAYNKGTDSYVGIIRPYCECLDVCKESTELDNLRGTYFVIGIFFALWYIITSFIMIKNVKERSMMKENRSLMKPLSMLPSLMNTFRNKCFVYLLPAWICDALVNAIIQSLLTYFVRYIVQPEYSVVNGEDCRTSDSSFFCDSSNVIGVSVLAVLIFAVLSLPLWLFITKKYGKRNTWLLWSLSMAVTNILFIFVEKGDVILCIIIAAINGVPIGAKFLADSILADVIDYDEFITGARSEATYTMFKSFLPKIAAIFASAIPIALLNTFGHIAPINGVIQEQPNESLRIYIRITVVIIPTILSVLAYILKLRFPLKSKEDHHKICEGIGRHLMGHPATDPLSGYEYKLITFDPADSSTISLLNHFSGLKVLQDMKTNFKKIKKQLCRSTVCIFVLYLLIFLASVTCTVVFRNLLETAEASKSITTCELLGENISLYGNRTDINEEADLSLIPVLLIIVAGVFLTTMVFSGLKFKALLALNNMSSIETRLLNLIIKQRKDIANTNKFNFPISESFNYCIKSCRRVNKVHISVDDDKHMDEKDVAKDDNENFVHPFVYEDSSRNFSTELVSLKK